VTANINADRSHRHADHKRHAPAPAFERRGGQPRRQRDAEQRAAHGIQALAHELPAAVETARLVAAVFHQQRSGRADLAAQRKALNQARENHQQRRGQANRRISRCKGDDRRAERHQPQRETHRRLAAGAVRIGAEHHAAHRPHDEAHPKRAHRQHQLRKLPFNREIQLADDGGEKAVDREIEELEAVAERDRSNRFGVARPASRQRHGRSVARQAACGQFLCTR
jgi:hypothetical protein